MKKRSMFLLLTSLSMCLCSCEIFNTISSLIYTSLDEYFSKNEYSKTKSTSTFNREMQEHVYFWSEEIRTYTNTQNTSRVVYSPRGDGITYHTERNQITIQDKFNETMYVYTDDSSISFVTYEAEDGQRVYCHKDLSMKYVDESNYLVDMDEEHQYLFRTHEYENGYLFVTQLDFMFFYQKQSKEVYLCVDNSSTFTNYQKSLSVSSSTLLTETLNKYQRRELFTLPIPKDYDKYIYYKDYMGYDNDKWTALDVILPYVDILDYVDLLQKSNIEIYRGEHHDLLDLDKAKGGEWVFYDGNHELKVHLEYENPIAVTKKDSSNYGVRMRIQRAESQFSMFGTSLTKNTDWSDSDKEFMTQTFGRTIPFIKLGKKMNFNHTPRANGEQPLTSALLMEVKCYWIFDNFYKDVITETYGAKLIEAGFTKYEPPESVKTSEGYHDWEYSKDYVKYECYLDESKDLAVKFMFDDIYGNTIKIFRISEMKAWWDYEDK